jgi:hypothetical protein
VADRCPWWARWHHRRLRRADQAVLCAIVDREALAAIVHAGVSRDRYDVPGRIQAAWARFKEQPGQAHWRCHCAPKEP